MDQYIQTGDTASNGVSVTGLGEEISEGTRLGRALEVVVPGLMTSATFGGFRDAWLGQGESIALDLTDAGGSVVQGDADHQTNEDLISRGYHAIRRTI